MPKVVGQSFVNFSSNNFIDVEGERKETVENFQKAGNYRMVLQSQVDLGWITNLGKLAGQKSARYTKYLSK